MRIPQVPIVVTGDVAGATAAKVAAEAAAALATTKAGEAADSVVDAAAQATAAGVARTAAETASGIAVTQAGNAAASAASAATSAAEAIATTTEQINARLADETTPDSDDQKLMTPAETADRISQQVYPTRAELLARNLPADQTTVRTSGRENPADDGDGVYEKSDTAPTYGDYFIQPNGNIFIDKSKDHTPERVGAIGDGAAHSNNSDKLKEWLLAAAYDGRVAVALGGRTYMIGDTVEALIDRPLDLHFEAGSILKGEAGPGAVLRAKGLGSARPNVRIAGLGEVNSTLRDYEVGVAAGTAIELIRIGGYSCVGGTTRGGRSALKGDSGIAAEQCGPGLIEGWNFYGHPDIGVYATGGGSLTDEDDSGWLRLIGCHFEDCGIAATARRSMGKVIMTSNLVKDCGSGFQTSEAESNDIWLPPGREVLITNNFGVNIGGAFVDLRVSAPGSIIAGNGVVNFAQTSGAACIGILGASKVKVALNNIVRAAGPVNGAAAISVNNYTDQGGTVYTASEIEVGGNSIFGAEVGVRNLAAVGTVIVTSTNRMPGVTTQYVGVTNFPHQTATGFGINTTAPAAPLHVVGKARVERTGIPVQAHEVELSAAGLEIITYSDPTNAKSARYTATTDVSNTAPSSGNTDHIWRTRTSERYRIKDTGQVRFVPLSADPSRAEEGDAYYNSTTKKFRFYNGTTWADI